MIYDAQMLNEKYKNYSNINQKISLECKKNNLVRIKRGLYTDNIEIDGPIISNVCYGPSYISFEYALSYYGLIPEYVTVYTAATYGKKNYKSYNVSKKFFEYRSIPKEVFYFGISYLSNDEGIKYKIACKEKALCDTLYSKYPVRSLKDLKVLLFDDLRIDENELLKLDFHFIKEIARCYHSNTILTLVKYLNEVEKNENSN